MVAVNATNAALCVVVDGRFVPLALVGWVGLYYAAVCVFVKLPEAFKRSRIHSWLNTPHRRR